MLPALDSRTDNHDVEVETLANTLAVPLVWQIGEADVASKLSANNVLDVIVGNRRGCDYSLANGLLWLLCLAQVLTVSCHGRARAGIDRGLCTVNMSVCLCAVTMIVKAEAVRSRSKSEDPVVII